MANIHWPPTVRTILKKKSVCDPFIAVHWFLFRGYQEVGSHSTALKLITLNGNAGRVMKEQSVLMMRHKNHDTLQSSRNNCTNYDDTLAVLLIATHLYVYHLILREIFLEPFI